MDQVVDALATSGPALGAAVEDTQRLEAAARELRALSDLPALARGERGLDAFEALGPVAA
ncbi:MAG TPA: hypothetical protein DFS52_29505 [Myxococcales bacterium]|nr:hypothetical protein [Myxococcales bacterium]